jgi:hypothetical protein
MSDTKFSGAIARNEQMHLTVQLSSGYGVEPGGWRWPGENHRHSSISRLSSGLTALTDFVDQVISILQRRGLFRKTYDKRTPRGHLGLPYRNGFPEQ